MQIVDFDGYKYVLQARGWLCPERGHTDEFLIELICNEIRDEAIPPIFHKWGMSGVWPLLLNILQKFHKLKPA